MSEEILIDGKTYISSRRAAEISTYAQDYIGQLSRKGLIEAKRVGGLWYVVMESLDNYKKAPTFSSQNQHREQGTVNSGTENTIQVGDKSYISAIRASEITGYNQDYVGQLARLGKIPSQQVGARWYVDPEAIQQHKREKDELLAKVQAESVGVSRASIANALEPKIITNKEQFELMSYKSTDGDLIPNLKEREHVDIRFESSQERTGLTRIQPRKVVVQNQLSGSGIQNEYSNIGKTRYVNKRINDNKRPRKALLYGIGILMFGSILFGLFKVLPLSSAIANSSIGESISALEMQGGVLGSVLGGIEQLISPELIYIKH